MGVSPTSDPSPQYNVAGGSGAQVLLFGGVLLLGQDTGIGCYVFADQPTWESDKREKVQLTKKVNSVESFVLGSHQFN
jgi:hypothetical protein